MVNILKCLIAKLKEGDIVKIEIYKDETELSKKNVKKLMNDLWKE